MNNDYYNFDYVLTYKSSDDDDDEQYKVDLLNVFNVSIETEFDEVFDIIDEKITHIYDIIKDLPEFIEFIELYKHDYFFLTDNFDLFTIYFEYNMLDKTHDFLKKWIRNN
jgi:hypothetical protein